MPKEKRLYHCVFRIERPEDACPVCGSETVTSNIRIALYDSLNQGYTDGRHKVHYCNRCHVPFLTETETREIESRYDARHVETRKASKKQSTRYLERQTQLPAVPIENLPKGNILFFGYEADHSCGQHLLEPKHYLIHSKDKDGDVLAHKCRKCGRIILNPQQLKRMTDDYGEYIYAYDRTPWDRILPDSRMLYLLDPNVYKNDSCPNCHGKLIRKTYWFKNDKTPLLQKKECKECEDCKNTYVRTSSFLSKPYSRYKLSHKYESGIDENRHIIIGTGDFLTRFDIRECIRRNHDTRSITARVPIVTPNGKHAYVDMPATECHTCGKYYILESTYQRIREKGVPVCAVVEEEYWRAKREGGQQNKGSIRHSDIYIHGYNVSRQNGLTLSQRHTVLDHILENDVASYDEICSHLDTLIKRSANQEKLKDAHAKWIADRNYMYGKDPAGNIVIANSIRHRTYKDPTGK